MFTTNLPPDSAVGRSVLGTRHPWGITERLLADVTYLLRVGLWVNADTKTRGAAPEPLTTPWEEHEVAETHKRLLEFQERSRARRAHDQPEGAV